MIIDNCFICKEKLISLVDIRSNNGILDNQTYLRMNLEKIDNKYYIVDKFHYLIENNIVILNNIEYEAYSFVKRCSKCNSIEFMIFSSNINGIESNDFDIEFNFKNVNCVNNLFKAKSGCTLQFGEEFIIFKSGYKEEIWISFENKVKDLSFEEAFPILENEILDRLLFE